MAATMHATRTTEAIDHVTVTACTIPTDLPEEDGTYAWESTTIAVVEISAGGQTGLGFTYGDTSTAHLIRDKLAELLIGQDAFAIPALSATMIQAVRNLGRPGIASMAISAIDVALWDLKARLLDQSLVRLLGAAREEVPVYGSGGFTSYTNNQLVRQLTGWVDLGIRRVKMKVGRDPSRDIERVRLAREAVGPHVELFVDANGAYSRKQALALAEHFGKSDVRWFEEPVSSDDLEGLRLLRDQGPAEMDIAAGEYGYAPFYFRRMLEAEAVDVLQADATRCGGISGFLQVAWLCDSWPVPLSAHTAPSIHAHVGCAAPRMLHVEYFHDHARIETMLFDGVLLPEGGVLRPDISRPGMGMEFKRSDAEAWLAPGFG